MQFIYKHRNKIMVAIMILMLIPFVLNIGLEWDEPFTMGLIRHGYGSIASLTALDVHPPLYYWVLKAFLSITAFWTSSIFIKIIFARLLSLIFSLVTLYYLIKILQILKLHYNNYLISFIFFMCSVVYGQEGIASEIRMYSLGAMLCAICFYYLLLFKNNDKLKYLPVICLSATFALYTQYLIGMIAGLYILFLLITMLCNKKYGSFIKLLLTGIISLILYIPWMTKITTQFAAQSMGKHVNIFSYMNVRYIILYYFIIMIMSMFIICNKKVSLNSETKTILFINIIFSLLILLINVKFNPYSISVRYTSILLVINYVIVGNALLYNLNKNSMFKIFGILFIVFLIALDVNKLHNQKNFQIDPSIKFYKEFNSMKTSSDNVVKLKKYNLTFEGNIDIVSYSTYLSSINKKVQYPKPVGVYVIGNGNEKLFKAVFPNIKNYTKR